MDSILSFSSKNLKQNGETENEKSMWNAKNNLNVLLNYIKIWLVTLTPSRGMKRFTFF